MERSEEPRNLRLEPIARWGATVMTAVICALSVVARPFGCAVGEFEEDRSCGPVPLSWASVALLVLTIVASGATRRRSIHWTGIAVTLGFSFAGFAQA